MSDLFMTSPLLIDTSIVLATPTQQPWTGDRRSMEFAAGRTRPAV
jgi:hypothetical protein